MTDIVEIVERLDAMARRNAELRDEIERLQTGWNLATKAVDTNESLRAKVERLTYLLDTFHDNGAAAEIERLRAALQAMMDGEPNAAQMAVRALEPKP
jgi:chromosome segregation ATPase